VAEPFSIGPLITSDGCQFARLALIATIICRSNRSEPTKGRRAKIDRTGKATLLAQRS